MSNESDLLTLQFWPPKEAVSFFNSKMYKTHGIVCWVAKFNERIRILLVMLKKKFRKKFIIGHTTSVSVVLRKLMVRHNACYHK